MKTGLISNIVTLVITTLLTIVVSFVSKKTDLNLSDNLINWIVCLLLSFLLVLFLRKTIWQQIKSHLARFVIEKYKNEIGLLNIYENYEDAKGAIKNRFVESNDAKIFIQLGRGVIGGSNSLLFEAAKGKKDKKNFNFKLLYADISSPYLTKERAINRKSNHKEWGAAIKYTQGSIDALLEDNIDIQARSHSEPYLWRLFIFDKYLYMIPYLHSNNNHEKTPVFEFMHSENTPSLYNTFANYFDRLWEKQIKSTYVQTSAKNKGK